jgi:hypothetical protein
MSAPTTRMLQAISEVAGNRLILQHRIIYRESSGRLFLAELVLSACHAQHMICSNGRGLHVFIISEHVQILSPASLVMGAFHHHLWALRVQKDSRVSDSICCKLGGVRSC